MSLLIKNIGELFTGYEIIKNTCIYIENGKIKSIGKEEKADEVIDAENKFVMPGFVDCHTHAIFSGYREFELEWKIEGMNYQEIASKGGGIWYTVEQTKKASKEKLKEETTKRIREMLKYGTTTAEVKSGYGLDLENEIKILEVINEINAIDIIPTFLAHAIPKDMKEKEYVDYIVNEILPKVAEKNLAKFCDVFCEKGYFSIEGTKKILEEAKKYGMLLKMHADEFSCIGCSKLAAKLKVISADHLLKIGKEEMKEMAKANVMATLLPAVPFVLNTCYPKAKEMMKKGMEISLATDLNPNCYVLNMQFIVQLACYKLKMKPIEALKAATINAAKSIKMDDKVGSIEIGKKADIIIMNIPTHLFIAYSFGGNLAWMVIKNGRIIVENQYP